MTTSISATGPVYDEFSGPSLDMSRWAFLPFPLPDGTFYVCQEPNAVTELSDGALHVHVERFENSHPVQPMDNSKHLMLSTADFRLPKDGVVEFTGEIAARSINATPRDYRDGFASLVVVDMASGYVFDLCATSDSVFAIHERLPFPGVDNPYTRVVEDPLAGLSASPDTTHACKITIDTGTRAVRWHVGDVTLLEVTGAALPETVKLGLGMFTLHPTAAGASRSLRGQGLSARWRNVGTTAEIA